jgi:hypothetical protein
MSSTGLMSAYYYYQLLVPVSLLYYSTNYCPPSTTCFLFLCVQGIFPNLIFNGFAGVREEDSDIDNQVGLVSIKYIIAL